jgi:hypothetical protein
MEDAQVCLKPSLIGRKGNILGKWRVEVHLRQVNITNKLAFVAKGSARQPMRDAGAGIDFSISANRSSYIVKVAVFLRKRVFFGVDQQPVLVPLHFGFNAREHGVLRRVLPKQGRVCFLKHRAPYNSANGHCGGQ